MGKLLFCCMTFQLTILFNINIYRSIIARVTPPTLNWRVNTRLSTSEENVTIKGKNKFSVYWNIPSQKCLYKYGINVDVSKYGIITNSHDGWAGEYITILPHPGLYPQVVNGTSVYGGIPQVA